MIVIHQDRITYEIEEEGGKIRSIDLGLSEDSISRYLEDSVRIMPGVTVEQFMLLLSEHKDDIDGLFDAALSGYPFSIYLSELDDDPTPEESLTYAEICHEATVEDGVLYTAPRFGAIGTDLVDGITELPLNIELTPISAYKHLELKLNETYKVIHAETIDGTYIETVLLECRKEFSLREVIYAFLFEISYYGTPEARFSKLRETLKSIRDSLDEQPGLDTDELPLSPTQVARLIKARIEQLQVELDASIEAEDYEKSAQIRDEIAKLTGEDQRDPGTNQE